ncbi:MAG: peroxiredoxin [Moraxellaceae bacterium]|nr:peroxiredoxin [Moraxellaceae bacterium]MCP5176176.1 peroxiredoxin [Moraxellaceae bacterium]
MLNLVKYMMLAISLLLSDIAIAGNWVGTAAPQVALADQTGKVRQLNEFKGKWLVLYFYPKNHTSGCTEEAKRFAENFAQFQKQNIAIVGVSLDSVESHKKFAQDLKLPFTLLSDSNKSLSKAMGVLQGFGAFSFASRETFLIDPQGTIVYHYDDVNPQHHATQILEDVKSLANKSR